MNSYSSILILELLTGSDPKAFVLGQFGLYVWPLGTLVTFLVFKGNDLHLGFSPKIPSNSVESYTGIDEYDKRSITDEVIADWNLAGQVKCVVYVSYTQKGLWDVLS